MASFLLRKPDRQVDVLFVLDKYPEDALDGVFPAKDTLRNPLAFVGAVLGIEWVAVGASVNPTPEGKQTALKGIRENKEFITSLVKQYAPKVIVPLGKASMFALEDLYKLPAQFQWAKVMNRLIPVESTVLAPSPGLGTLHKDYLNLYTLVENVAAALKGPAEAPATQYTRITSPKALKPLLAQIPVGATVGLDTETTGLNFQTEKLLTVQFSWADYQGITVDWEALNAEQWQAVFSYLHKNRQVRFVLQNGKFDYKFLRRHGIRLPVWEELSVAHAILDERPGTHNLEFISQQLLGEGKFAYSVDDFAAANIDAFSEYAARDADLTRRAFLKLEEAGATATRSYQVMRRIARTLADAEYRGWAIDPDLLDELILRSEARIKVLDGYFTGLELNPLSVPEVKRYLETDDAKKETLQALDSEVADRIVEYKSLRKVLRGYLLRIKANAAVDGRFHADYRLTGTVTGRLSAGSGSPKTEADWWKPINIQNIPRAEESGDEFEGLGDELRAQLRNIFVASPGKRLVGADLAAAEMRIAGTLAQDPRMVDDMNRQVDTHSLFAIMAFRLPVEIDLDDPKKMKREVEAIAKSQRTATKRGTFASLYGGSEFKIAMTLGIALEDAKAILTTMYSRWPGLRKFFSKVHKEVQKKGVLEAPWGRIRHFPYATGVFSNKTKAAMLREAQNWLIQLTASEYLLDRMAEMDERYGDKYDMLAVVHDAVYMEVDADDIEAETILQQTLERKDPDFACIMFADAHGGQRWGEL